MGILDGRAQPGGRPDGGRFGLRVDAAEFPQGGEETERWPRTIMVIERVAGATWNPSADTGTSTSAGPGRPCRQGCPFARVQARIRVTVLRVAGFPSSN
jgi:hypothetical protein